MNTTLRGLLATLVIGFIWVQQVAACSYVPGVGLVGCGSPTPPPPTYTSPPPPPTYTPPPPPASPPPPAPVVNSPPPSAVSTPEIDGSAGLLALALMAGVWALLYGKTRK